MNPGRKWIYIRKRTKRGTKDLLSFRKDVIFRQKALRNAAALLCVVLTISARAPRGNLELLLPGSAGGNNSDCFTFKGYPITSPSSP